MATKKKARKKATKKAKARRVCMVVPANKKVKLVYKKGAKRRRKAKK